MEHIAFEDWEIWVDKTLTQYTYRQVSMGGADSCKCEGCKNFVNYRLNVYPYKVRKLFGDLGIDINKECEVWHCCKENSGKHIYSGWFHFKGNFVGKNCIVPTSEHTSWIDLTVLTEDFKIGFCYGSSLTFFEDTQNLVQVEFEAKIPWTIDNALEYE